MTEYWVSKKQYWCKYCNIFIRDDAPSRRQHETGLKHQGNKERFIRDLYKGGNQAKREREAEAIEMARIEASAARAHANDVHLPSARPSLLTRLHASAAAPPRVARDKSKPQDRFANYSTAAQLGFEDEDTQKSAYEIEQELKGRAGDVGAWQVVAAEPQGYAGEPVDAGAGGGKRKLGEYGVVDEHERNEEWRFEAGRKRPVRDPYDDEDWDPRAALKSAKGKDKVKLEAEKSEASGAGLDRTAWSGKIEVQLDSAATGRPIKAEDPRDPRPNRAGSAAPERDISTAADLQVKAEVEDGQDTKPAVDVDVSDVKPEFALDAIGLDESGPAAHAQSAPDVADGSAASEAIFLPSLGEPDAATTGTDSPASNSLFKKRRPPPSRKR